uniref:Uncharacterized protein n=1 Tax=Glossina pallidipes TaxID=7398 RepID=A0A1B0ACG3_GLOPL
MDNEEACECLKQRQINYCKVLMQKKREEPIQWESFVDDGKHRQHGQIANTLKHDMNTEKKFSHNGEAQLIPTEILKDFDSRNLNYQQNDKLRRLLTQSVIIVVCLLLLFKVVYFGNPCADDCLRRATKKQCALFEDIIDRKTVEEASMCNMAY